MKKQSLFFFVLVLFYCFNSLSAFSQNKNIDSLLTLIERDKEDTLKVLHLNQLTEKCTESGRYDTAFHYNNRGLKLAQRLHFQKGIATCYQKIGIIFYRKGNFPKAQENFLNALKINEQLNDQMGIAAVLRSLGTVYTGEKEFDKALDCYYKSLKINETINNKNEIAINLTSIGSIFFFKKEENEALKNFLKALALAKETNDSRLESILLGNIAGVYFRQKKFDKTLPYAFEALRIAEAQGDKLECAKNLCNIGSIYNKIGNYKEAEKHILKAITIADSIGALDNLNMFEANISEIYFKIANYKEAYSHYKKSVELKDTLFSRENRKQLIEKEMKFEFEKKENAAKALQEKKDVIANEEKEKQNIITYSVSAGLLLVGLLALITLRSYRRKQKDNITIIQQKKEVEQQKKLLEIKNNEITDSINYAKHIQQAKLPAKQTIYASLPNCFVLFKPKDIVSGDFYFFHKNKESVILAAADCTGHGVPGALMSMIGSERLEDAVSLSANPSQILKLLNKGIKLSLKQSENNDSTRDGMDIAICNIQPEKKTIQYAGANRPIWIIRKNKNEIEEIKPTKMAIGGFTENNQHFESHELQLQTGDTFYIFSDGYADLFNGQTGKKLTSSKLKHLLLEIQSLSMQEQEKYLDNFAKNWNADTEQIDDILVIGVRMH